MMYQFIWVVYLSHICFVNFQYYINILLIYIFFPISVYILIFQHKVLEIIV